MQQRKSYGSLTVEIAWEDLYKALEARHIGASAYNVKLLCRYLEKSAKEAVNSALVDFVQNVDIKLDAERC